MKQFLDEKSYKPGLGEYDKSKDGALDDALRVNPPRAP